jgi:LacI family transcriptional regulator
MVTQKDVARQAGVSTTTVSHVINETRHVSEELRARVCQAMEELNYRPNAVARSLRRKRTRNIAVILPDIAHPFLAEVARSVEDASFKLDYSAIMCESHSDPKRESSYINLLQSKQADGLVFVGVSEDPSHIHTLIADGPPIILCGWDLPEAAVDAVTSDDDDSGYQAAARLIQSGRRRIACITGPPTLNIGAARVEGYRRALITHDIPVDEQLIVPGDFQCQGGYDAMRALLALNDPPTAVFACNDMMAMGAICASSQKRLRIPQDIAVVGCDDIALAAVTNPSLTTVAHPKRALGAAAVEILVQRIEDKTRPIVKRVLPIELVIRDSG